MKRSRWMKLMMTALIACTITAFAAEPAPAVVPVKGNPTSKIYHKPACRHYKAKGSTKTFKNEADAKKAGYKSCKRCAEPKKKKETEDAGKTE